MLNPAETAKLLSMASSSWYVRTDYACVFTHRRRFIHPERLCYKTILTLVHDHYLKYQLSLLLPSVTHHLRLHLKYGHLLYGLTGPQWKAELWLVLLAVRSKVNWQGHSKTNTWFYLAFYCTNKELSKVGNHSKITMFLLFKIAYDRYAPGWTWRKALYLLQAHVLNSIVKNWTV